MGRRRGEGGTQASGEDSKTEGRAEEVRVSARENRAGTVRRVFPGARGQALLGDGMWQSSGHGSEGREQAQRSRRRHRRPRARGAGWRKCALDVIYYFRDVSRGQVLPRADTCFLHANDAASV